MAWRSTASARSARVMPSPSSLTRMSRRPPPSVSTSMRVAPASSAFSTSSLTTLAGRSTTSPAAMRLTMASESWRTGARRAARDRDARPPRRAAAPARSPSSRRSARHARGPGRSAAPSARRSRRRRPECPFGGVGDGEIGEVRPVERAAGGGVARAVVLEHRAIAVLDLDGGMPATSFSIQPSSAISAAGKCGGRARARQRGVQPAHRLGPATAATATASSAVSCSMASSQCGSGRGSSSSRLRERSERSSALTRLPCSASTASTSRSRKRRRSEAGPLNSVSIAGTSQTTRRWSAKAAAEATGSRSMRHLRATVVSARRRLDAGAERGEAERAFDLGRHRPRAVALAERDLVERRRGAARGPGARNEIASIRLVLPAPFGPTSTTGPGADLDLRGVVAAEIRQREAADARRAESISDGKLASGLPSGLTHGSRAARQGSGNQKAARLNAARNVTPASASARRARLWSPCPGSASASRDRRA